MERNFDFNLASGFVRLGINFLCVCVLPTPYLYLTYLT